MTVEVDLPALFAMIVGAVLVAFSIKAGSVKLWHSNRLRRWRWWIRRLSSARITFADEFGPMRDTLKDRGLDFTDMSPDDTPPDED